MRRVGKASVAGVWRRKKGPGKDLPRARGSTTSVFHKLSREGREQTAERKPTAGQ